MSDIFYDNGTVFFVMETGDLPASPYWTDFIRIGATAETIQSDEHGNWLFADEDSKILGLQMEDPLTDAGTGSINSSTGPTVDLTRPDTAKPPPKLDPKGPNQPHR